MFERLKKNMNEWYSHSLGIMILAIVVVLNGHIEISFTIYATSIVLMGIGALYNQNKRTEEMLKKLILKSREEVIYERLKEYEEKGDSILMSKEDVINGLSKDLK